MVIILATSMEIINVAYDLASPLQETYPTDGCVDLQNSMCPKFLIAVLCTELHKASAAISHSKWLEMGAFSLDWHKLIWYLDLGVVGSNPMVGMEPPFKKSSEAISMSTDWG